MNSKDQEAAVSGSETLTDQLSSVKDKVLEKVAARRNRDGDADHLRVPEFFGFESSDDVFTLAPNGTVISRRLGAFEEPRVWPVTANGPVVPFAFSLPLDVSGNREATYPLSLGLTLISGHTQAGKSRFLKALGRVIPIDRCAAVEPYDDPSEIGTVPTFSSASNALAYIIRRRYIDGQTRVLPAIDSLRAPLFETTGPAGSKGIIMPFFTQLTRVSNCLAMAGMTVLATVNPMEEDADFATAFLKKLKASTSTCILVESYERTGGAEVFKGTVTSRPLRLTVPFTFCAPLSASPEAYTGYLDEIEFTPHRVAETDELIDSSMEWSVARSV